MERFINVAGAQTRTDRPQRIAAAGGVAAARADARGQGARQRHRGLPRARADHLLSALVDGGRRRDRQLLRARNAEPGDAAAVRGRAIARHRLLSRLCRTGEGERRDPPLQHLDPGGQERARSSANTARCICPATPTTGRTIRFSIWRSAISSRATSAFRSGAPSAAMSACASATTGAGRRPIGSWGMQSVELVLLGYNTPTHLSRGCRSTITSPTFTTTCACRPAPTRTAPGWSASPRPATRRAASFSPAAASSRPRARSSRRRRTKGDEVFTARCDLDISRFNKEAMFNFAQHRRIEHYGLITRQAGAIPPQG